MTGPVGRLLVVARPEAGRLLAAVAAGVAAALCAVGLMATSAWLISRAAQQPPVLELTVAIVAVRAFSIFRGVLRYGERLAGHDAGLRVLGLLRVRAFTGAERVAPRGLGSGDALSRFAADVDTGLDVLVRVVLPYAVATLAGAASVAFLGSLVPAVGIVLAISLGMLCVAVPAAHHAVARRAERRIAPLRGELATGVLDLWSGLADLTAFGAVPDRLAALGDVDRRLRRATARSSASVALTGGLVVAVTGGGVVVALILGTGAVRAGQLDGVVLAALVLTPLAIFELTAGLPAAAAHLGTARAALRRVFAMADAADPVPVDEPRTPLPGPPYWLRVDRVSARWEPSGALVFRDLTLDLPAGRRVAVVGPTGGGKSTLAALLVRFLDPVEGQLTLNGVALRHLDPDDVRHVVGLLSDDAYCFDTTIAANLRIGRRDASDEQLRVALAGAGLLAWVDSLPAGLQTAVGENGARLSGGQRRRLGLARILLADPPILVLDEPTEHLDEATARTITDDILTATATQGRTLVLITHRPHGIDRMDEVITLSADTVVR